MIRVPKRGEFQLKELRMEAVILAGGLGTRLRSVIGDLPKPLALVNGRPFLYYVIDMLMESGINKITFSLGYRSQAIIKSLNEYQLNNNFNYVIEDEPLGTGGAIQKAIESIDSTSFFVINGDSITNLDFQTMYDYHKNHNADISIAGKYVSNVSRYGVLKIEEGWVRGFSEKNCANEGIINVGVYLMNKVIFNGFNAQVPFSFEKDFLEKRITEFNVLHYVFNGIPDDYNRAEIFLKNLRL